jgi:hypothetical protein
VPLEWVYFFIFQIYDWVVNFPLLKFNIWRFSSYDKVKNWSVYLLWILVWISECATNKSYCHNITELQSMTLGFGTYKPFGPVHMRTLLARIHIHWPESKLTKSHINWKKVMKSDPWYHMFILLIKKKYESLCLELLQFVLLILITALPFIFTQPLVIYWYMSNLPDSTHHLHVITFKPLPYLRETGQNAPTFFRITIILPKWHV